TNNEQTDGLDETAVDVPGLVPIQHDPSAVTSMKLIKFVINLKNRTDRRFEMTRQLDCIGWQAEFTDADRPMCAAGFPSIGTRGCFMNHLVTLKRASAVDAHVVIMEDDLNFKSNFSIF